MNEQEITIKVQDFNTTGMLDRRRIITAEVVESVFSAKATPAIMEAVFKEVTSRIANELYERHAPAIFEQLAPGAIADAIEQKLKAEIVKKVLG